MRSTRRPWQHEREDRHSGVKRNASILPYADSLTAYVEYDPGAIGAAATVGALIASAAPWAQVEHIGSTAVPGCAGKGIVDLMALQRENERLLSELCIAREDQPNLFPRSPVSLPGFEIHAVC